MAQVLYKGKPVKVWKIGHDSPKPDWVQKLFDKQVLVWLDDQLRVFMYGLPGAKPYTVIADWRGYAYGFEGEVLDITNYRIVSKKKFQKNYQVLDDQ